MSWLIGALGVLSSIADDDVWVVDSTPVECALSRGGAAVEPGWVGRIRLLCIALEVLLGVASALGVHAARTAGRVGVDRREGRRTRDVRPDPRPHPGAARPWTRRQITIADKNYFGRTFAADVDAAGIELLRPARKGEPPRPGQRFFKPLRQVIESINQTLKGQLDLERHAITAAIWHNDHLGNRIKRSLTTYDH